jgi:hypothetical protein
VPAAEQSEVPAKSNERSDVSAIGLPTAESGVRLPFGVPPQFEPRIQYLTARDSNSGLYAARAVSRNFETTLLARLFRLLYSQNKPRLSRVLQ